MRRTARFEVTRILLTVCSKIFLQIHSAGHDEEVYFNGLERGTGTKTIRLPVKSEDSAGYLTKAFLIWLDKKSTRVASHDFTICIS